jgi:hypothetical protein
LGLGEYCFPRVFIGFLFGTDHPKSLVNTVNV